MNAAFDEHFMRMALREAMKAADEGEVPLGAVVVAPAVIEPAHDGHPAVFAALQALIGAEVSVCGIYTPPVDISRKLARYMLFHFTGPQAVTVLRHAPKDPFAVPPLPDLSRIAPTDLPSLGRRRATGRVLAVWGGDNLLIAASSNEVIRVSLVRAAPPRYGETVDVVGIPETDTYRIQELHLPVYHCWCLMLEEHFFG